MRDLFSVPVTAPIAYNPVPKSLQNPTHTIAAVPVIDYPPLKRTQFLEIQGSESEYRTQWFELPSSYFNVSGLGAVIILPTQYTTTTNDVEIVVCNLNAGWGPSSINTTWTALGLSATTSLMDVDVSQFTPHQNLAAYENIDLYNSQYKDFIDVAVNYLLPVYPNTTISIQKEWAEYLNPRIPHLNTTTIDYMMKASTNNKPAKRPEVLAKYTLGALLTNGLARIGADYQFQGDPRLIQGPDGTSELDGTFWLSEKGDFFTVDPEEARNGNWVKLRVDSTIQGYAYNTRGTGPKTAMAFLLAYSALALAYTIYTGISGASTPPVSL